MQWFAQAPSNIALIKYMGKEDETKNSPDNPSLSFTLNDLQSNVMLEQHAGKKDYWEALDIPGALPFTLSEAAQQRFLYHFERLKHHFNYDGSLIVRSSNNFPHSSGLASSASSFAALTKVAVLALCELTETPMLSTQEQASLSRLGSGSSCRSFFSPWALWDGEHVDAIDLPYPTLLHEVIIISNEEKKISSSEAHRLIRTSPLYQGRPQRARNNLKILRNALDMQDWASAYSVCWHEFQDMHQLFSSASPSFSYMNDRTQTALSELKKFWEENNDGPIVTMDAGPNIHLLFRPDQAQMAAEFKQRYLINNYDFL